jgi:hypothetical protein
MESIGLCPCHTPRDTIHSPLVSNLEWFSVAGVALWLWLDLWRDNRELATTTAYYIFPVARGLVVVPSIMLWIDFLPDKPSPPLPKSFKTEFDKKGWRH